MTEKRKRIEDILKSFDKKLSAAVETLYVLKNRGSNYKIHLGLIRQTSIQYYLDFTAILNRNKFSVDSEDKTAAGSIKSNIQVGDVLYKSDKFEIIVHRREIDFNSDIIHIYPKVQHRT